MKQKNVFPDGGFGFHKIDQSPKSRISAWYDKNGNLLDAEWIFANGSCRQVTSNSKLDYLQQLGKLECRNNP